MNRLSLLTGCIFIASCGSAPEGSVDPFEVVQFSAPLETTLVVETGNAMFVSGAYIKSQVITLSSDVSILLPGSLGIPFPVTIAAGRLSLTNLAGSWKYFCAPEGRATATFPGLGSVVAKNDCIGIRQSLSDGRFEWVVDNSNHTRSTTIWSRKVDPDYKGLTVSKLESPFRVRELTRIIFDGVSGGQYRFTLEEISSSGKSEKSFSFDRNTTGETVVGIKGKVFRVISADNIKLQYAWVKL